jgi:hypothetical protein
MAHDDFAIVVGIARYPRFGATSTEARDLVAPDDDAQAVYQWLVDPDGGNVPDDVNHIRVVRTSLAPPGADGIGWPPKEAILQQFDWLESLAETSPGSRVGRRLYFYAGGHGFARRRKEGALFAANASRNQRHHVFASRWVEWFANAAYFDEVVLWMDTCMWPDSTTPLETIGYRDLTNPTGDAKMFSAYAARFPLQAVERTIDGNRVKGVFTYTLLQGLRTAVVPGTREVTTGRLRDYLTNRMSDYLTADDKRDALISKEPDFGFDDHMVLCTLPAEPTTTVTLTGFPPGSEGQAFEVLTGSPPESVAHGTVQSGKATLPLEPRLHFVQMTNPVFAKGFGVSGEANVTIDLSV